MTKQDAEKILMGLIESLKLTRKEFETLAIAVATLKKETVKPEVVKEPTKEKAE